VFKSKTLFIVGAGGSFELDLPVGEDLKGKIADKTYLYFESGRMIRGDAGIYDAIQRHALANDLDRQPGPYVFAGRTLSMAMPQAISIDNYLDAHRGNKKIEICGKLVVSA
jgi:hypothetical protein